MRTAIALCLLALPALSHADATTPPVRYEIEGNALKVPGPVYFETNSDKIKPEGEAVLQYVKGYLDAKSYISLLRIEVHSDAQGAEAYNQTMTEKRALAVAKWLVSKGVDCKRVLPVGFGSTKPVDTNATAEGRAKNRRTMFVNAALRGRPIGGMPVDGGGKVAGDPCK